MVDVRLGLATCAAAPRLDEDASLLLEALAAAGAVPIPAIWDDPSVPWTDLDGVLIRSVWDYPTRPHGFLEWLRNCPVSANPYEVVAWNSDKRYLDDLSQAQVATVPTVFLAPGQPRPAVPHDFVVKPAVSGSAADTGRFGADRTGLDEADRLIARLHQQGRTAMVQPYLDGIDGTGETSMIYLAGEFSHAVRRRPLLTEHGERRPVVVADVLATTEVAEPTPAQHRLAERALAAVPGGASRLSYARVDLVPGPDGPVLLELEAIDCYLFLSYARPAAVRRFAQHVVTELGSAAANRQRAVGLNSAL